MTAFFAILFGVVEGLTEFLPISSTAHLVLLGQLLGLPPTAFLKTFEIAIQSGAIVAVLVLFQHRLRRSARTWILTLTAFVPTALIGFLLYQLLKNVLLESVGTIAVALILGGLILLVFERWLPAGRVSDDELKHLSLSRAALLGLAQALAIIPGVSRSGATVVAGRFAGLSRAAAVEFSFLLAVPTILAAGLYDLWKSAPGFAPGDTGLFVVGFLASFVVALGAIRWLLRYVTTHDFRLFGWYRIILGIILLLFVV